MADRKAYGLEFAIRRVLRNQLKFGNYDTVSEDPALGYP